MSDIRKFLDIVSESSSGTSTSGSVASLPFSLNEPQKRADESTPEETKKPEVIEYGNWENSALTTSNKLKKERKKASKVVKSIYGEDVQSEAANPKQQAAIAIAKKKEVAEGKFTVNRKTGAKLDPRTGVELPKKEKPLTMKDMFSQPKSTAPKLTLDDVWMKIQSVVSNIYPDGDPIDHLAPWLEKHGIRDFKIGEILDRAAKKNGYKDLYDYWDSMGELPLSEQGMAEGENIGGERYDKIADLQRRSFEQLTSLIKKLEQHVEKYPQNARMNEYLGLARMIRAQKIGKKGVAEGRDNPLQDIDPRGWHLVQGDRPIAINFPDEYTAKSFHSGHGYGRETKILHGSQVRQNAYLQHNPGVINYPEYSKGVAEGSEMIWIVYRQETTLYPSGERDHETEIVKTFTNDNEAEAYADKLNSTNRDEDVYYFVRGKRQGVAEGSEDKVHLKTPKHGLADHPGRNTGVGLRTFSQTPEQDRCPKCNSLFKNHYKQGVAEAAKWRRDDLEGKTWRSPDWDDGDLSPSKIKIDHSGKDVDDDGDELNIRPGMWRGKSDMAKRMTKKGVPTKSELAFQDNLKMRMRMKQKQGGLTGPKGNLPEQGVAEGSEQTEETAVINMFEKLVKQGRDPIDMIAHKFFWGSYELDQLAKNLGFKNSAGWTNAVRRGKGVNKGVSEGNDTGFEIGNTIKTPDGMKGKIVGFKNDALSVNFGSPHGLMSVNIKDAELVNQGVTEAALEESDLIINPASIGKITRGLVAHEQDRTDHEIEMAKGDLYQAGKDAVRIFELIRDISEEEGLEGWVQEKIIKAADYLNIVREYLEGKEIDEEKMYWDADRPAEPWNTIDKIVGSKSMSESMDGVGPSTKMFTSEAEEVDEDEKRPGLWDNMRKRKASGKRMRKPGEEGAPTNAQIKSIRAASNESVCNECGGPAYDDEMLAEERDACYSKVKSRYKVWPSAYASGALVKCRKVGAKNWGNKSKK